MFKKYILILIFSILIISCDDEFKSTGKAKPDNNQNKKIGYIQSVIDENGKSYIKIDYFDWFSDEEAGKAMKEDDPKMNLDDLDGIPPDGYYIRNEKQEFVKAELASDLKIIIEYQSDPNKDPEPKTIQLKEFKSLYQGESKSKYIKIPFWVEFKNGIINKIEEQIL